MKIDIIVPVRKTIIDSFARRKIALFFAMEIGKNAMNQKSILRYFRVPPSSKITNKHIFEILLPQIVNFLPII